MVRFLPFRGFRPPPNLTKSIAAPAYDTLSSEEARVLARGNPMSFLRVNKPEICLPRDTDAYSQLVYKTGANNLDMFVENGWLKRDPSPHYYIYMQEMHQKQQYGIVGGASVRDYEDGLIKKHELTREKKEKDRTTLTYTQNANVGPVFLTYRASQALDDVVSSVTAAPSVCDFVDETSGLPVRHAFWVVEDRNVIKRIGHEFSNVDALYVADGHHRAASAFNVGRLRRREKEASGLHVSGDEPFNFFMAAAFPHSQVRILDYNRVVRDLHGMSAESFLEKLSSVFIVEKANSRDEAKPKQSGNFGMYVQGQWYRLHARVFPEGTTQPSVTSTNLTPAEQLDGAYLTREVLKPLLGIGDLRQDERIDFVGGIRGLAELERRVDSGEMQVAFAVFPVSVQQLMAVADANELMPPKSTWFEPKMLSGLVVNRLD